MRYHACEIESDHGPHPIEQRSFMGTVSGECPGFPLPMAGSGRRLVLAGLGSICVSLPGQPTAKKRPRFTVQHGKVHTYPDTGQIEAEAAVARAYMLVARRRDLDPAKLWAVELWFDLGPTRGRADIDNLTKLWLDALNGWAWKDDKQVAKLGVTLMRGSDKPGAFARITEVVEVTE